MEEPLDARARAGLRVHNDVRVRRQQCLQLRNVGDVVKVGLNNARVLGQVRFASLGEPPRRGETRQRFFCRVHRWVPFVAIGFGQEPPTPCRGLCQLLTTGSFPANVRRDLRERCPGSFGFGGVSVGKAGHTHL